MYPFLQTIQPKENMFNIKRKIAITLHKPTQDNQIINNITKFLITADSTEQTNKQANRHPLFPPTTYCCCFLVFQQIIQGVRICCHGDDVALDLFGEALDEEPVDLHRNDPHQPVQGTLLARTNERSVFCQIYSR